MQSNYGADDQLGDNGGSDADYKAGDAVYPELGTLEQIKGRTGESPDGEKLVAVKCKFDGAGIGQTTEGGHLFDGRDKRIDLIP